MALNLPLNQPNDNDDEDSDDEDSDDEDGDASHLTYRESNVDDLTDDLY